MSDKPFIPQESRGQDAPVNRAYERRRDDDYFTTPKITIYDIDYAILWWLQNRIKSEVEIDDNIVEVPVIYGNGEKWAQIQSNGFLKDDSGKDISPLIVINRTEMTTESDLWDDLNVENNPTSNSLILLPPRSTADKYDHFSKTNNAQQPKEFYATALPKFVTVTYEMVIWADFVEQMNIIVQDIFPTSGYTWGDTWQFATTVGDFSFETVSSDSDDRIVKATSQLTVQGILLDEFEMKKSTVQKAYSLKRVLWANEKSSFDVRFDDPPGGYTKKDKGDLTQLYNFLSNSGFNFK